jgi:glycosyltransferase involved in cell wall biosynthesis
MAARLPVVASRHGISSDVLGEAGIMVDTHDPLALAAAIDELLRDEAQYRALAAAGEAQLRQLNMAGAGGRTADLLIDLLPDPT